MKRTESTSSACVLKKTQLEEFDLVILGVAWARPSRVYFCLAKASTLLIWQMSIDPA